MAENVVKCAKCNEDVPLHLSVKAFKDGNEVRVCPECFDSILHEHVQFTKEPE